MGQQEIDEQKGHEQKEAIKKDAEGLFKSIKTFMLDLLDFRGDTDRDNTIQAIKNDIPFKGATAWILIFAIFIASIGLNVSSTAVVIGAMLISPLMGPILGVGLSLAINDIDTLRRSIINLLVMVVLSVLTAYLYFELSPLTELTPELESRTAPTILDVFVAIFGGLALIVARTKKGTIASVIFGVAIATALMPPLCTAGYGLAVGNIDYFLGAMYLFTINSLFIALSTFVVVKILRFPMIKYANSKKRKRIAQLVGLLAIVAMIPAGFTFLDVLNKSNFEKDAKLFISQEITDALPNFSYIKRTAVYHYEEGNTGTIELTSFGQDQIPESTLSLLKNRMGNYSALKNAQLLLNQSGSNINFKDQEKLMKELRLRDSLDLMNQSQKIVFLEDQVSRLSRLEASIIPFKDICDEAKLLYTDLRGIRYSNTYSSNFTTIDTLAVFSVQWNDSTAVDQKVKQRKGLEEWLKYKLKLDTLVVQESK
jgi:uncharacterized hydrophobic protein (TIGR00271 family)